MSDKTRCKLNYLVKGIRPSRDSKRDLAQELTENLPNAASVVVLPVVEGYSVEIEVHDVAPFSSGSFEPYVADHVLPEAVHIHCEADGEVAFQLLKARFN